MFGQLRALCKGALGRNLQQTKNDLPNRTQSTVTSTHNAILPIFSSFGHQVRHASNLSPRRTKYRKSQKGKIPLPTGGSTKGTTVVFGTYGLRIIEGARLTAFQLTACHSTIRRKIKAVKGSRIWMRVFPDIPVTSKGNETRMGKGKGAFDYWACRVPLNRIVFEVGGVRKEIAKEALRLGAAKLPVKTEFVERGSEPVVGAGYKAVEKVPLTGAVLEEATLSSTVAATGST
ncbi:hypothetical protein BZG36_04106 [Bifiguratus adelaidae]|uniref:Uncharacterized protein n=1 Tax=Bifiguratus adelaidae TaxID=1938954 RepID=A0A261XVT7_9FUNG|nr:hypothetical protein BZG36_04106 [Bifiguratus adelaidae]